MDSDATIDDVLGPCPLCGNKHHFSTDEVRQMLTTDAEIAALDTDLHAWIRKLGQNVTCARCIIDQEHATGTARRAARIDAMKRRTYREGLIPQAAKSAKYDDSSEAIEAQNPDAWAKFRALPLVKSLWVFGHPGTGKTFAARCVLNGYLDMGRTAGEISAHRVNELGRSFKCEHEMKPYTETNILLVEDIDKPAWHSEGVSALWRLVDMRRTADRRCIITSNLSPPGVSAALGLVMTENKTLVSSLFDRLMPIERVEMQGDNLRRQE